MKDEILDEPLDPLDNGDTYYFIKILVVIFVSFMLSQPFLDIYTKIIYDWFDSRPKFINVHLILVLYYSVISCYLSHLLNKGKPKLQEKQIAIFTGLIIFVTELLVLLKHNWSGPTGWITVPMYELIKPATVFGLLGGLVGNIAIHRFRKKSIGEPAILFIIVWIVIVYISSLSPYQGLF